MITLLAARPVSTPVHFQGGPMKKLPLAIAIASALPVLCPAETAITIYSSAQPGTLNPQTFKSGGEAGTVPGYALVREEREFSLQTGPNLLPRGDLPGRIDPT